MSVQVSANASRSLVAFNMTTNELIVELEVAAPDIRRLCWLHYKICTAIKAEEMFGASEGMNTGLLAKLYFHDLEAVVCRLVYGAFHMAGLEPYPGLLW